MRQALANGHGYKSARQGKCGLSVMALSPQDVARAIALIDDGRSFCYAARTIGAPYTTVQEAKDGDFFIFVVNEREMCCSVAGSTSRVAKYPETVWMEALMLDAELTH
ncbi:hypothetical protein C0J52_27261 [Blattella germanica]|nr:hypothetical protein C0J52_27261 [Blattella germanica]